MPDQPPTPGLTVHAIRATPVEVPLNFVLGTGQGAFRQAPLLLIDLETEEGVTGRAYLFCYLRAAAPAIMSLLGEVERVVKGEPVAPAALWAKLARPAPPGSRANLKSRSRSARISRCQPRWRSRSSRKPPTT